MENKRRNSKKYRSIYENYFKKKIPAGWVVHHIDCNENNNTPLNLIAMPERMHNKMHSLITKHKKFPNRKEIDDFISSWMNE